MKILIDARFWGPMHTGLGVYSKYLVLNLAKIDEKNSYVLLIRKETKNSPDFLDLPGNFQTKIVDIPPYSLAEQLVFPWVLYTLQPDIVHFTSINVPLLYIRKYIVTVHDLIKHQFVGLETTTRPGFIYWLKYFAYLLAFQWLLFWSRKILVPSNSVKNQLLTHSNDLNQCTDKVVVTYEAPVLVSQGNALVQGVAFNNLPEKFAVYTGNAYPHKNLPRLIEAWKEVYIKTRCVLVLICGRSIFAERIEKLVKEKNASRYVRFFGYVSDFELTSLYQKAEVFVYPTLSEGFGLPGLDAMLLGLPMVCSDIPVLHEVYADAAIYFDPKDEKDMASKIIEVITNKKMRSTLIDLGKKQAQKYSWYDTARKTLLVYESCFGL